MSHAHGAPVRGPQAGTFERVIADGGVVLFPSDTVYGLACDPADPQAIEHLYALKGRPMEKATAVMFFDLHVAFDALPDLGERTRALLHTLLPGPVTVLLPNPQRQFGLACGADPDTLGLRVVSVPALAGVHMPVLQSSANPSGEADARTLDDVAPALQAGADLVIDGGELPGAASTVLDLRAFEIDGEWTIIRPGPIGDAEIAAAAAGDHRFVPDTYDENVAEQLPDYEALHAALVAAAAAVEPTSILELGTGTGRTARTLLDAFPRSAVVGVDGSSEMMEAAADKLPADRFTGVIGSLARPLPDGPFDLVASALTVHHLDADAKVALFREVHRVLKPGGRFVLADVVLPEVAEGDAVSAFGFDKPSTAADQLRWLRDAGFETADVVWSAGDLVVVVADVGSLG